MMEPIDPELDMDFFRRLIDYEDNNTDLKPAKEILKENDPDEDFEEDFEEDSEDKENAHRLESFFGSLEESERRKFFSANMKSEPEETPRSDES